MKATSNPSSSRLRERGMNPHSVLYQVGRLFFPELINRGRAMRFRMLLITVGFGAALIAATTVVLWKEYRSLPVYAKEVAPLKPLK